MALDTSLSLFSLGCLLSVLLPLLVPGGIVQWAKSQASTEQIHAHSSSGMEAIGV